MARTSQDNDSTKRISENLKRVDRLVKEGKLQEAATEIERARDIDPLNMYVHAYQERLRLLREQEKRNKGAAEAKHVTEDAARKGQEADTRKKLQAEPQRMTLQDRPAQTQARSSLQTAEEHSRALEAYNRALFEVWVDGTAAPEEEKRLADLRSSLLISAAEHLVFEAAAKRECYVAAFRNIWSSGSLTPEGASTLKALRKKFSITAQEFEPIELELLHELRPKRREGMILVVDDDPGVLRILEGILLDQGFGVRAYTTSDDAYKYLKSNTPDLIISDVNLESSTMGGLAFLEKVREIEHLVEVPFIFLSGLTDEVVIRTGKTSGADDYVTKPFDQDTLMAVIRGKLKRFRQLRSVSLN